MSAVIRKIKTITLLITIFLGVCFAARLGAADTFTENFSTSTYKGVGTTADWNTEKGVLRLPSAGSSGNTKQINGCVTVMGSNLYYAWIDFRGGIGDDNGHIYLRMFDKTGTIQGASDVQVDSVYSGSYISDGFSATYVKTINDGTFVYVFWVKNSKLFLQKFDASASRQWESGDFQVNSTVDVSNYNYSYVTGLVNSDGTLSFFWDSGSGVYMQKVDPSGAGARVGNPIRLLGATGNPVYVDLTTASSDSVDNYYLIYSSYNSVNSKKELFLDKFDSSGTEDWSGNRVTIGSSSDIYGADIATDASGNSYVVWGQLDSVTGGDIFIAAVDSNGDTISGWSAKKVYTDTGYYNQNNPKVWLDSTNAPNVIWEDSRASGKLDIYAQRFNTSGTALLAAGGVKVNIGDNPSANALSYTGYNSNFVIDTADNSLYVTWYAYRSADFDVCGQKVSSSGAVQSNDWEITQTESGGGFSSLATAESLNVNQTAGNITYANVCLDYEANGQTITLFLSNDGGATWKQADIIGGTCTFTSVGSDLRWQIQLSSADQFVTPIIYSLLVIHGNNNPYHKLLQIYDDKWYYPPTGFMAEGGHVEALSMDSNSHDDPVEGSVCAKITWNPNAALWAGFYVQASGLWRAQGGTGIDLSAYKFLEMKVRVDEGNLENMAGVKISLGETTGDSGYVSLFPLGVHFSNQWQTVLLNLKDVNLHDINGLLSITLATSYGMGNYWPVWDMREGIHYDYPKIYVDDIKFVGPGPAVITDLKVALGSTSGSVNLTWTVPEGDYTNAGYIVKYSENYISNQIDFNNATTYSQSWIPGTPGSTESYVLTGLTPGQGYYFAVVTKDEQDNQSNISNSYYFIARSSGIGILVEGDVIDLGTMAAGDTKTGGSITVTNIGGINMTTSLSLTDPPGWIADSDNSIINHYVLLAAFGSSEGAIPWNIATQALSKTATKSTTTRFAGDQTGEDIPVDAIRRLYIRFTAPQSISAGTARQTIFININAESVD